MMQHKLMIALAVLQMRCRCSHTRKSLCLGRAVRFAHANADARVVHIEIASHNKHFLITRAVVRMGNRSIAPALP